MTAVVDIAPADRWLLPILTDLLPRSSLDSLESGVGESYWRAAVDSGLLTNEAILEALSARTRFRIATDLLVSAQARDSVSERLARRFRILPLAISESTLEIATSNPYDLDCEQTLAFATARAVRMCLAPPDRIQERIEEVYAPADQVSRILERAVSSTSRHVMERPEDTDSYLDEKQVERPVIKLVDHIVAEGIAVGASDIHLEAGESGISVRYRIDGMLKEVMVLPKAVGVPLVSRIKIMSQMDIADRLRPQGGRARVAINGARVDLRVSTLPASHGEKVVIRILDSRAALRSVDAL
ncbi:MAG TPA: ATPase, T2SS/T4P/T4SS family, partial [Gemmatimonadaceae bacterium]|nr:ATPase, T2SS/T4P/T4SS family [Gemmatimonadaceae bacterium]